MGIRAIVKTGNLCVRLNPPWLFPYPFSSFFSVSVIFDIASALILVSRLLLFPTTLLTLPFRSSIHIVLDTHSVTILSPPPAFLSVS